MSAFAVAALCFVRLSLMSHPFFRQISWVVSSFDYEACLLALGSEWKILASGLSKDSWAPVLPFLARISSLVPCTPSWGDTIRLCRPSCTVWCFLCGWREGGVLPNVLGVGKRLGDARPSECMQGRVNAEVTPWGCLSFVDFHYFGFRIFISRLLQDTREKM